MNNVITIEHPSEEGTVPHRLAVGGRYWGEGQIQCLVLSADNRWYTQREVIKMGDDKWVCPIVLGFDAFTHPTYTVAAGQGGKKILEPSVSDLPNDVLWTTTELTRKQ